MEVAIPLREQLAGLMREAEARAIHGLLFQHIELCPTRAWLHYHRLDCAHLNRHMQLGLLLHEYSADGRRTPILDGLSPDRVDWGKREVSEIKKSRSHETALTNQLLFYIAALSVASGQAWRGVLRYTASRRIKTVKLDETAITRLRQSMTQLSAVLDQPLPPKPEQKSVCVGCSYRIMCWGLATEDEDT